MKWIDEFEAATGARVERSEPVTGGDIAESQCAFLRSGARCFVKIYPNAEAGQTQSEAEGLRWLAAPRVISVAEVIAVGEDWLALDWIESGSPRKRSTEQLGRSLARLHTTGASQFGLDHDNWIGSLPQDNGREADWPTFFGRRRLQPLIESAQNRGLLDPRLIEDFEVLLSRLGEIVGPAEPPARLHGDLWSGNVLFDGEGCPWLIDPAAYAGHREMDLAMMQLFGGFSAGTFHAYQEEAPLSEGAAERVALYQLYPLLVHLLLFGGSYREQVRQALAQSLGIP